MKPISEIAKTALDNPNVENQNIRNTIDTKIASMLFVRFDSIWPGSIDRRWPNPNGLKAAKVEWAMALQDKSSEAIGRALKTAQKAFPNYFPSLPAFVAIVEAESKPVPKPKMKRKRPEYEDVKPKIDKLRKAIK